VIPPLFERVDTRSCTVRDCEIHRHFKC